MGRESAQWGVIGVIVGIVLLALIGIFLFTGMESTTDTTNAPGTSQSPPASTAPATPAPATPTPAAPGQK